MLAKNFRHPKTFAIGTTAALLLFATAWAQQSAVKQQTEPGLRNPLLATGPDPWVTFRNGYYFYTSTTGRNLTLWKTRDMADLRTAERRVVWTPPASGPYSKEVWAPELHYLEGKWYLYFAADSGSNETHRIYALEGDGDDPLQCNWTFKGKVADKSDRWAIDATVVQDGAKLFLLWSGWEGDQNGTQNIYIAQLQNPWTVASKRTRISTPQYPWEKVGGNTPPRVDVNEGPEALQRNGRIFVTYSASGCWTDSYALGMLTARQGADLLNASSWSKSKQPVFSGAPDANVFSPGHNGFFQSPDGKQDWIIYHANSGPNQGCGDKRSPRAQPFTWNADGTPNFGKPMSTDTTLPRPTVE